MNWTGLKLQFKAIRHDKLCILTFLLPIIVGLAINLLGDMDFSSVAEPSFGIVKDDLSEETIAWLYENGTVAVYKDTEALRAAIIDPSTQTVGVMSDGTEIQVFRSGDEMQMYAVIADVLPQLYTQRNAATEYRQVLIPSESGNDILKTLLVVITMVTAMFMGCTFNAMNILSEKEDGIVYINEILPMSRRQYIKQKIAIGFLGGILSTIITAFVCIRLSAIQILPTILLISLSAFIASLTGLLIARFAGGLMVGIAYIKIVMIMFLAPPIFFYLIIPSGSILHTISYVLPSSATFYGLIGILEGNADFGTEIAALIIHSVLWLSLYVITTKHIYNHV